MYIAKMSVPKIKQDQNLSPKVLRASMNMLQHVLLCMGMQPLHYSQLDLDNTDPFLSSQKPKNKKNNCYCLEN